MAPLRKKTRMDMSLVCDTMTRNRVASDKILTIDRVALLSGLIRQKIHCIFEIDCKISPLVLLKIIQHPNLITNSKNPFEKYY